MAPVCRAVTHTVRWRLNKKVTDKVSFQTWCLIRCYVSWLLQKISVRQTRIFSAISTDNTQEHIVLIRDIMLPNKVSMWALRGERKWRYDVEKRHKTRIDWSILNSTISDEQLFPDARKSITPLTHLCKQHMRQSTLLYGLIFAVEGG